MLSNMTCPAPSAGPINQIFSMLIQGLLVSQCSISDPIMWPNDYGLTAMKYGLPEYDFIVIGAGSAGAVVANRLSENPDWQILLLEAGGDPPVESEIPSIYSSLQYTEYDWIYHAEKSNKHSKILKYGSFWPRGRLLGGSSSINAMVYLRGFPKDFDQWAEMGNEGWDYETVLEYFKKSENNKAPGMIEDEKYHSTTGPMKIDFYYSNSLILKVFEKAVEEMGFDEADNFNGDDRIGFGYVQGTLANGRRESTAKAFLSPLTNRLNVHVIKYAHVTNLDIKEDTVTGVNFNYNSVWNFKAIAKNEVILSAGAINTPQILMLSGIGPEDHLNELGIEVQQNLSVGKNLQDHVYVSLFITLNDVAEPLTNADVFNQYYQYLYNRTGTYATVPVDFVGFFSTELNDNPDIEIRHNPYLPQSTALLKSVLTTIGYPNHIVSKVLEVNQKSSMILVWVTLLNPKSTGVIKLVSTQPEYKPKIFANYFENEDDLKTIVQGTRMYSKILETDAFKEAEAQLLKFDIPECDDIEEDSLEYWTCYAKYFSSTLYHPVGTAKMGPEDDESSVVDPTLKVKGMQNLRVIDASIMPTIVSTNTNAASIMIGERGSDLIKEEWESS